MDSGAMERRRLALEKMDNAKFSWYHVRYAKPKIAISN